jgi:hypothetical protein
VKIKKTQFFFPFPILPFLSDSFFFFFSNRTVFLSQFFVFVLLSQFSFSSLKQFFFFFFSNRTVFLSQFFVFVLLSQFSFSSLKHFFFSNRSVSFSIFCFRSPQFFFLSFCLSVSQNNVSFLFSQNSVSFFLSFFFFPNRSVSFSIFFIFYFIFILRVMIVNLVIPL